MDQILLWITAVGTVVTALATGGLVLVAWLTLSGASAQLGLLREQAEREGRPYIVIDIVPGLHGIGYWDLVIRNLGRTSAHGVTIQVPNLTSQGPDDDIFGPLSRYLATPRTLVPGARHRVMWSVRPGDKRAPAGAPDSTTCVIRYADDAGRSYEESCPLTLLGVPEASPAPTEGATRSGSRAELANINHALRALNRHVGEMRR